MKNLYRPSMASENIRKSLITAVKFAASACIIRLVFINYDSLWIDELWTLQMASKSWNELNSIIFLNETTDPYTMPIHIFFMKTWVLLMGKSIYAIRLPGILFSALSIIPFHLLLAKYRNKREAFIATLLYSFIPFHLLFSLEAGPYSLLCLESIFALYNYFKALQTRKRMHNILTIFFIVLAIFTHYFGFILVVVFGINFLYLIIRNKQKHLVIHFSLIIIPSLLLFLWIFCRGNALQSYATPSNTWLIKPTFTSFFYMLISFLSLQRLSPLFSFLIIPVCSIIISCIGIYIMFFKRQNKISDENKNYIYNLFNISFIALAVVPFVSIVGISYLIAPAFTVRYCILSSIGFYILLAVGISYLLSQTRQVIANTIIIAFIVSTYSIFHTSFKVPYDKISSIILKADTSKNIYICDSMMDFHQPLSEYYLDSTYTIMNLRHRTVLFKPEENDIIIATNKNGYCKPFFDGIDDTSVKLLDSYISSRDYEHSSFIFNTNVWIIEPQSKE